MQTGNKSGYGADLMRCSDRHVMAMTYCWYKQYTFRWLRTMANFLHMDASFIMIDGGSKMWPDGRKLFLMKKIFRVILIVQHHLLFPPK